MQQQKKRLWGLDPHLTRPHSMHSGQQHILKAAGAAKPSSESKDRGSMRGRETERMPLHMESNEAKSGRSSVKQDICCVFLALYETSRRCLAQFIPWVCSLFWLAVGRYRNCLNPFIARRSCKSINTPSKPQLNIWCDKYRVMRQKKTKKGDMET